MTYDEVGNMTSDGEDYDYEYDAFGRLRKILKTGTSNLVAEYRYNGLNQRITAHYDTDLDLDVDGSDTVQHFAYDSRWRMVARYEDANTDPTEQWVHHNAGLAASGSGSYIDSVILRDRDTTGNGTLDERLYYLQNWRSDVVALITDTGDQREHVRYEPYGTPFGLPAGDIDSDGDFDATDYAGITGSYDVRKDVNMDGSITFADTTAAYNINGLQTMGRGVASSDAVLNRKGYAGYEHLAELAGAKWDVRNRILISELGTWNRRDPLGYVDGMNLYAYVAIMPITMTDEAGEALASASAVNPTSIVSISLSPCGAAPSVVTGTSACAPSDNVEEGHSYLLSRAGPITTAACKAFCADQFKPGKARTECEKMCKLLRNASCNGLWSLCEHLARHRLKVQAESCFIFYNTVCSK